MFDILEYKSSGRDEIINAEKSRFDVSSAVTEIIDNVRKNGDKALLEYCKKFDGVKLSSLRVTQEEMDEAMNSQSPEFIEVLELAAENIRNFHSRQKRNGFVMTEKDGICLGQRFLPIERVGVYCPSGSAPLPSSVLMNVIPAKIAGCQYIAMVASPTKDGKINAAILAAAKIAGVNEIYKVGGAQAIAALAYGTETIKPVDKITGPGSAYVAEAKKQVFGKVAIDMIAGPSEILVIADGKSNPANVAADLLSQAEHDKNSSAILLTDSPALAEAVQKEAAIQLEQLARKDIAGASAENNGKIIIMKSIDEAVELANGIAPEHLELCLDNPFDYLGKVKNAGSVFLGRNCPEALGDYLAGTNHTLPTMGTARFSSPLSVDDFMKSTQFIYYSDEAMCNVADKIATFAEVEGLTGHARSAMIRKEK